MWLHSGLLGAVCVVRLFPPTPRVGCFLSPPAFWGLVRVLPFLCCWSALVDRLSVLECAFWGFLLLFALLHLFPLLRLVVTLGAAPPHPGILFIVRGCAFGGFLL